MEELLLAEPSHGIGEGEQVNQIIQQHTVWHYTIYDNLIKILVSEEIKLTSLNIEFRERPAVWFSINQDWEETVRPAIQDIKTGKTSPLSRDALSEKGFPPARIEVNHGLPFMTWDEFKEQSNISRKHSRALEKVARIWGADPNEWRVLFSPVGREHWGKIEIWNGKTWLNIDNVRLI